MADYQEYTYHDGGATHAHSYVKEKLISMLDPGQNKYILDIGCGNGSLVNWLINKGLNAYGMDASKSGIQIAKKIRQDRFANQDITSGEMPYELAEIPFDTIICVEVIEHLYDPERFIKFAHSVLAKKGGEIIISTPYHGYLKNLLLAIAGRWGKHADPLWSGGHIKFWSRKSLSLLLENAGFKLVNFKGCGRIPYVWKSMLIKAVLIKDE